MDNKRKTTPVAWGALGLLLIASQLLRENFGFTFGSGAEVLGFNFATLLFYILGGLSIYKAFKLKK